VVHAWAVRRIALLTIALSVAAALAGATPAAPAACRATPNDSFGPFGQGLPPLRSKTGTGHVLTGVVLSAVDCKPVRGAQVQLWQANRNGVYVRALSGTVLTDGAGRFRYESPRPTSYEGLPPHIHVRVVAKGYETLLSRIVVPSGTRRTSARLVLVPALV
jgi:protocatechuate 3,4-dioxygenase beta subunit